MFDDSNKLVIGKMKNGTGCVVVQEFARLQPKLDPFFVDDNSKHKKKTIQIMTP